MGSHRPPDDDTGAPRDAVTGMWPVPDGRGGDTVIAPLTVASGADTIVAPATAPGRGGIGIVRISGPAVRAIAAAITEPELAPRHATLTRFIDADGDAIDAGLALFFPGPGSFTGEDVLELHGHGGPMVMELLVERALELGARRARPGEFTERAFLNDKVDLAQAEAVADLINAGSAQAARAAMRSLQGEFSTSVQELVQEITALRVYVEAAIDFPDEDVEFLADPQAAFRLSAIQDMFERITQAAGQGRALRDGITVVIAGRPNAGKSSLLNRLAGYDAAIVTDVPGTTRDILRERIDIDGLPLHIVDTAGLRETADAVEGEGVRRAQAEIARADLVLYVIDAAAPPTDTALAAERRALPAGVPVVELWNKVDLLEAADAAPRTAGAAPRTGEMATAAITALGISATTGHGLDELRACLKQQAGYEQAGEGAWSARARHLDALARGWGHVEAAVARLEAKSDFELVAEELRLAQRALGEITGEVTSEELLGQIFSSFCIGK